MGEKFGQHDTIQPVPVGQRVGAEPSPWRPGDGATQVGKKVRDVLDFVYIALFARALETSLSIL
jgi:hypothetical protein